MRELPREWGLQLRMLLALALSLLIIATALYGLVVIAIALEEEWWKGVLVILSFPAMFILVGALHGHDWSSPGGRSPSKRDTPRVKEALQPLALLAGVPMPRVEVTSHRAPLSWTTSYPWREPMLHVSTGLLDRLDDRELHAVLAHELAHMVHRDALLMTLLAGPPAYLLRGLREAAEDDPFRAAISSFILIPLLVVPAGIMLGLSRVISRARELAADRAAAVLTGSPASVAAALMKVDGSLAKLRSRDLRKVAALDAFHFVPAKPPRWFMRPWSTHPPTEARIARLERFEAAMQATV